MQVRSQCDVNVDCVTLGLAGQGIELLCGENVSDGEGFRKVADLTERLNHTEMHTLYIRLHTKLSYTHKLYLYVFE